MRFSVARFMNTLSGGLLKSGWDKIGRADVLVVRHDADCGYQYEGKAYSPIVDSIVEICFKEGLSVRSLATPFSRLAGESAFNYPVVLNRSFLWIALMTRVLGLFIGRARSRDWMASKRARLWRRVLDCVKPGLVLGVQPDVHLCRACRARNVPIYDVQHGVIAPDHWWYGKKLRHDIAESDLPDGFLCWDRSSEETLAQWAPSRGSSVCVVGNPWFQRFQHPDINDQLVQETLGQAPLVENNLPAILVSLQWGLHIHYYKDSDFNKVMCTALETVIKRTHDKYNWLLRLHPVQLRGQEGQFCEDYLSNEFGSFTNVEWRRSSRLPLPVVLKQSDLHITDMSTVVTEAAWLGVPSALLNPYLNSGGRLESLYQHERQSGMAKVVPPEVDAIESWIGDHHRQRRNAENADLSGSGFHNWLKNTMVTNG